jgi:NAD+ synthase
VNVKPSADAVAAESALGLTYSELDDYLQGAEVTPELAAKLGSGYLAIRHERAVPVTPLDDCRR